MKNNILLLSFVLSVLFAFNNCSVPREASGGGQTLPVALTLRLELFPNPLGTEDPDTPPPDPSFFQDDCNMFKNSVNFRVTFNNQFIADLPLQGEDVISTPVTGDIIYCKYVDSIILNENMGQPYKFAVSFDEGGANEWETSCEVGVSADHDDKTISDGIHFQVGENGCCFIEDIHLQINSFPPSCN